MIVVTSFVARGECGVYVLGIYFAICLAYSKAALVSTPLSHP